MRPKPRSLAVFSNFEQKQNPENSLLDNKHLLSSKEGLTGFVFISYFILP